ncbi:MAG: tandem-95 repeat protein, partial [Acidobacteria bacterium]|nr:tandem-95 repeat protein [Acidobacteriota bacterium]
DDADTTSEDVAIVISVLSNDSDIDGDTLSVASVTQPANGSVVNNGNGTITYTPNLNYNGADSFTYTISDGSGGSDTATVSVTVDSVNDAPVVDDQTFAVDENSNSGTVVGVVAAGDPDAGDTLSYAITSGNASGAFAIDSASGQITVSDAGPLDFEVTPTFLLTVQVTDDAALPLGDVATVTINLSDINEVPVVDDQVFAVDENSAAGTIVGSVTAGDPDAGQTLTFAITSGNASGAFAIDSATGQITVSDAGPLDFEVTPTFALIVRVTDDGAGPLGDSATVTVNLGDVNEAPTVANPIGDVTVSEDAADTLIVLTGVFADEDNGDSLTLSVANDQPSLLTASVVGGSLTLDYLPDQNGTASVTVRATDGQGLFVEDVLVVSVTPVNDAPTATDDAFSVAEDSVDVTLDVLANDSITPDTGETLTISSVGSGSAGGTITIAAGGGSLTYSPLANFFGSESFTYTINDGTPGSDDAATVTVTVTPVNDAPTATGDGFAVAAGGGTLFVRRVQPAGSGKVMAPEWVQSVGLRPGARFGS